MPAQPLNDTRRLCVHTITTKPLSMEQVLEHYPKYGVAGITVWRQALEGRDVAQTGKQLRNAGMSIVSLCRGGFFPAADEAGRKKAIGENIEAIDEAATLGAPLVVLVCGAVPGQPLDESRKQIADGIAAVAGHAQKVGVKLAVEPLHPMYADSRSAINTMRQANDLCEALKMPNVGVAVDVYHLWWDPELQSEIARCGRNGHLYAFHICDWRTPTEDLLNDRGLMGDGCIDVRQIRGWVEDAGFDGFNEVEVFSNRYWAMDQRMYLERIVDAYKTKS
ncbi:MAG: sugar phosphate isomerase/epimerase [Planctomycetes bacterium]|nr:sugar phosphate isomerase/epimerase [Planctomycetota bacterium]